MFTLGAGRKKTSKKQVFHFFETISNSVFVVILGLFVTIFLSFFGVAVIFFNPLYNQITLFSLLGAVFFSISYKFFLVKNGIFLRNLTYANFLVSRNKLFCWVVYTFNFYFLLLWFILIILGSTEGFHLYFPTEDYQNALLVTDPNTTKILGFILLCVHIFLFILIKIIVYYWSRWLNFASREFEKRRRALETVRNKVKTL